jgi:hypothetical protein
LGSFCQLAIFDIEEEIFYFWLLLQSRSRDSLQLLVDNSLFCADFGLNAGGRQILTSSTVPPAGSSQAVWRFCGGLAATAGFDPLGSSRGLCRDHLGQTDAKRITIRELDASRLKRPL